MPEWAGWLTPELRALMVAAHGEKETVWCQSTGNYCCSYHEGWSDGQEAALSDASANSAPAPIGPDSPA